MNKKMQYRRLIGRFGCSCCAGRSVGRSSWEWLLLSVLRGILCGSNILHRLRVFRHSEEKVENKWPICRCLHTHTHIQTEDQQRRLSGWTTFCLVDLCDGRSRWKWGFLLSVTNPCSRSFALKSGPWPSTCRGAHQTSSPMAPGVRQFTSAWDGRLRKCVCVGGGYFGFRHTCQNWDCQFHAVTITSFIFMHKAPSDSHFHWVRKGGMSVSWCQVSDFSTEGCQMYHLQLTYHGLKDAMKSW